MSRPTMDPERTLTQRELNRALLARQLPLERVEATVPRALERRGLQAQYAPSMYLGLFSRLADLPRESLTRPLERGTAQATLMRAARETSARRSCTREVQDPQAWAHRSPRRIAAGRVLV